MALEKIELVRIALLTALSVTATPVPPLKAMMLPSFAAVPPMVLTEALSWMWTPSEPLPSGWVPVLSVPMKLPSTRMSGGAVLEDQAVLVVAGDDVAGGGRRAADDVADGGQLDAVVAVGDGDGAGAVGADEVALDGVVADGAGVDAVGDAVAAVAGDDVAVARGGAADGVVGAAQQDAVELDCRWPCSRGRRCR